MIDKGRQFTVGIFIFAGIVIFIVMIFMVGSDKGLLSPAKVVFAKYKHIQGLKVGASVHLAGIQVGYVDDISFIPTDEGAEVLLTLKVNDKYFFMIRSDSFATIATQGVLGDKYIQMTLGSLNEPQLKSGDFVRVKEMESVIDKLGEGGGMFDRVDSVLVKLDEVLGQLGEDQKMLKIVSNLEEATLNLKTVTHKLNDPGTLLGGLVSKTSRKDIGEIILDTGRAAESLSQIMRKIDEGSGTIGALVNDPTLYEDLKVLLGGAKRHALLKYVVRESLKKAKEERD
jgi:phospholipid/cholesterol/gamma-HCH transport system substrate-binding protein